MSARARVLRVEPPGPGKLWGGFAVFSKTFALYRRKVNVTKSMHKVTELEDLVTGIN